MANGSRFLGQEPGRHAVPAGWIYLPLFVAGDMPTKAERYELLERARRLSGSMNAVE